MKALIIMVMIFALGLILAGFLLSGIGDVAERCAADLGDLVACESARLRQTIFAASLAGSGIVALAGVVCTVAIRFKNSGVSAATGDELEPGSPEQGEA